MTSLTDLLEKTCNKCGLEKLGHEYHKSAKAKDGLKSTCKRCIKEIGARKHRVEYGTPMGRARMMLKNSKRRAKKSGLEHTIDLSFLLERLELGVCEITQEAFDFVIRKKGRGAKSHAPSIHRKDSSKGYTPDNTMIVLWHVNAAINQYEYKEFFVAGKVHP